MRLLEDRNQDQVSNGCSLDIDGCVYVRVKISRSAYTKVLRGTKRISATHNIDLTVSRVLSGILKLALIKRGIENE